MRKLRFHKAEPIFPGGGTVEIIPFDFGRQNALYSRVRTELLDEAGIARARVHGQKHQTHALTSSMALRKARIAWTMVFFSMPVTLAPIISPFTPVRERNCTSSGLIARWVGTTTGTFTLTLNGEAATLTIGSLSFDVDASGYADVGTNNAITTDKGVLTITGISNSTVSYEYTLTSSQDHSGGEVSDTFAVNVIDATGDKAETKTLTINIVDDEPEISAKTVDPLVTSDVDVNSEDGATASVDITDLFSINPGADGQKSLEYEFAAPSITGVQALVGTETSDGTTYAWETVTVTASGSTVTGTTASGQTAFVVSVVGDTVKFDQKLALQHPNGEGTKEMTLGTLTLNATLTDNDNDTAGPASSTITLKVQDDVPTITVNALTDVDDLEVHEAAIGDSSNPDISDTITLSLSDVFDPDYGEDGPGLEVAEEYGFSFGESVENDRVETGLYALGDGGEQGDPLYLYMDPESDNRLYGATEETSEDNDPWFELNLNDGELTFTLLKPVWHDHTDLSDDDHVGEDEAVTLDGIPEGMVKLDYTIYDGDEDSDTKSLDLHDLGIKITIKDDVPTVSVVENEEPVSLAVDESWLQGTDTQPVGRETTFSEYIAAHADNMNNSMFVPDGNGSYSYVGEDIVEGAGEAFSNVASLSASSLFDFDYGKDGPISENATVYSLNVKPASSDEGTTVSFIVDGTSVEVTAYAAQIGSDTPLQTYTHDDVYLFEYNGSVYGVTLLEGEGETPVASSPVFEITIDEESGEIQMEQYTAILHDSPKPGDDYAEANDNSVTLPGMVQVKLAVTDADNDTVESPSLVDIALKFEDDVPAFVFKDNTASVTKHDGRLIVRSQGTALDTAGADGPMPVTVTTPDGSVDVDYLMVFDTSAMNFEADATTKTFKIFLGGADTTEDNAKDVTMTITTGLTGQTIKMTYDSANHEPVTLLEGTLDTEGNWRVDIETTFRIAETNDDGSYIYEEGSNTLIKADGELPLAFRITDSEGDTTTAFQSIPLKIINVDPNEVDYIGNGEDEFVVGNNGAAGTVAPGDVGGVTGGTVAASTYNICFILDTSSSMTSNYVGTGSSRQTRLAVAKESIQSFIEDSVLPSTTKTLYNMSICTFDDRERGTTNITIDNTGDTPIYKIGNVSYGNNVTNFLRGLSNALPGNNDVHQGTNYQSALNAANTWFGTLGDISSAKGNLTYFLTDGCPASGTQNGLSNQTLYESALPVYATLISRAANMEVNAIGFGVDSREAMSSLALFDNTTDKLDPDGTIANIEDYSAVPTTGGYTLYYGTVNSGNVTGTWRSTLYEGTYEALSNFKNADTHKTNYYYVEVSEGVYHPLSYSEGVWSYTDNNGSKVQLSDEQVYVYAGGGVSTQVETGDALSAAFQSGFSAPVFDDASGDTITVSNTSGVIYGDAMCTDMLRKEVERALSANGGDISVIPGVGSGYALFTWLQGEGHDVFEGTNTKYATWTKADTLEYMVDHSSELAYETVAVTNSEEDVPPVYYVRDLDGNYHTIDVNAQGKAVLSDPISSITLSEGEEIAERHAGVDRITGGDNGDIIFGQEGDDVINGGGGDDQLYGGSGSDVIHGGEGDDYIHGGAGSDNLYGDDGNDILLYDAADTVIDGGNGIDFLLSDDSTLNLDSLLGESGNVDNVEVLLNGTTEVLADLLSIAALEKDYDLALKDSDKDGNADSMTLTKAGADGTDGWIASGNVYEHHDSDGIVDLTMDVDVANLTVDTANTDTSVIILTIANSNG